jgi:hypothetical protein
MWQVHWIFVSQRKWMQILPESCFGQNNFFDRLRFSNSFVCASFDQEIAWRFVEYATGHFCTSVLWSLIEIDFHW